MCFQILGFDIMIDKNFRPWLIEVNQSPSFATDSPLDYQVKKGVLKDAFNLLNVDQEKREKYLSQRDQKAAERMLTGKTVKFTGQERQTQKQEKIEERILFERMQLNAGSGYELIHPVLDEEKQEEYDMLLRSAQKVWDDFTTGKKGKKPE